MKTEKKLTLEEKAQTIRERKRVIIRSGEKYYSFKFKEGGNAFVKFNGKKFRVKEPGTTLYAIAGEKKEFILELSALNGDRVPPVFLTDIEVFPRIW